MPRLAQKWYEEDCRSPPAITRTNRQMEKERYSFRNRLHAPRRGPFFATSQPAHSLREFFRAPPICNGSGIAILKVEPSPGASSLGSVRVLLRNPDELTDSVPIGDFTVANWRCFYTLRAAGPYPVKTQARFWGICRMLSLFLSTTRSWRSVFKCNRIHRNGG